MKHYESMNRLGLDDGKPKKKREKVAQSYARIHRALTSGTMSETDAAVARDILANRERRLEQLAGNSTTRQQRQTKQKMHMLLRSNCGKIGAPQHQKDWEEFMASRHISARTSPRHHVKNGQVYAPRRSDDDVLRGGLNAGSSNVMHFDEACLAIVRKTTMEAHALTNDDLPEESRSVDDLLAALNIE